MGMGLARYPRVCVHAIRGPGGAGGVKSPETRSWVGIQIASKSPAELICGPMRFLSRQLISTKLYVLLINTASTEVVYNYY